MKKQHPSLARIYGQKGDFESLYFDETFTDPKEGLSRSFYLLCAVQIEHKNLHAIREELYEIAGGEYWHSTEALQTAEGKQRYVEMLEYCRDWKDPGIIACKIELEDGMPSEEARRDCIRALLSDAIPTIDSLGGLIFEARQQSKDNDRDRRFIKKLREEKVVPQSINSAWVSPAEERILWLPDIIGMSFRRTITHADDTAEYFDNYLSGHVRVIEV